MEDRGEAMGQDHRTLPQQVRQGKDTREGVEAVATRRVRAGALVKTVMLEWATQAELAGSD